MAPVWAAHGDRYIPPLPCSGACVAGPDGAVLTKCEWIPAWILVSIAAILVFMAVCTALEIRVDRVTKLDAALATRGSPPPAVDVVGVEVWLVGGVVLIFADDSCTVYTARALNKLDQLLSTCSGSTEVSGVNSTPSHRPQYSQANIV